MLRSCLLRKHWVEHIWTHNGNATKVQSIVWSMDQFLYSNNHSNAIVIATANTWLRWNLSKKKLHWFTLRLPHRPQLVISASKLWEHVWIYTVWSSAINTISDEPPLPPRSQLRRKARSPAISLAPGDSASNGADRCCENKSLPFRVPGCLIPKLWNIWNDPKTLEYLEWSETVV